MREVRSFWEVVWRAGRKCSHPTVEIFKALPRPPPPSTVDPLHHLPGIFSTSEPQRPLRGCDVHTFTPAWTSPLSPDCLSQSCSHPRHLHPEIPICHPPTHPSPPGRRASSHPLLPCLTTPGEGPVLSVPSLSSTPCPGSGTCLSPGCHNNRPTGVPAWIRLPQTSSQLLRSNMWLVPGSSRSRFTFKPAVHPVGSNFKQMQNPRPPPTPATQTLTWISPGSLQ